MCRDLDRGKKSITINAPIFSVLESTIGKVGKRNRLGPPIRD